MFVYKYIYIYLCDSSLKYGGALELIGVYRIRWHVGAGLTPYNMIQNLNGNTIAKLSALSLVREEAVVAA